MRKKLSPSAIISLTIAILIPVIFLIMTLGALKARFASLHRSERKEITVSSPPAKKEKSSTATMNTDETVSIFAKTDFVYPTDRTRDPFSLAIVNTTEQSIVDKPITPLPILTGVIWDENNPIAILTDNSRRSYMVRKNAQVMSLRVTDIYPRSVSIERDGQEYELKLWKEDSGIFFQTSK